jgi:hypothetical protein
VLVIRGRANNNYRASFNRIYSVGSNGGWVQGSKLNPLESLTPPLTKRLGFAKQKDPEQVMREAEHKAAFEAKMETDRQLHEEGHLAKDALAVAGLLEQLEQPAARSGDRWGSHGSHGGKSSYGALPAISTSIEVQWTDQNENYLKWFTAVVVKPDVTRLEARQEKRPDRLAKCHQIRYTAPPNEVEWVLLEWAGRPTKSRQRAVTATSKGAIANRKSRAKQQAADTAVPWRYQGQ